MKLSVLHISDLHRDPANPVRNDVLLDSLENDRRHYSTEQIPTVRSPDLIIVSGDMIRGIKADTQDPDAQLREQYREALDFLAKLTDRFVGGNRNHVIIVPGNHDVSAYHFQKSLCHVDIPPDRKKELVTQLFQPGSRLRWSWSDFGLYEISDHLLYMQRLSAFADFYAEFYSGTRTYDLDPAKQIDIFDFPTFGLTIAAFSSCYDNDLFNKRGAIHPGCIAIAGTRMRDPSLQNRLLTAVWHHSAEGLPEHSDYMDPDFLQNMIDRGFSLGFHGHQHRAQFLDTRFRHGTDRKLKVISAGTLGEGMSFWHRRSYNVVELDVENRIGRLHVREMKNDNLNLPIWGQCALPPNNSAYYDFELDPPLEPQWHVNLNTAALIEAQRLRDLGYYCKAADLLIPVAPSDALARPLLLDCLVRLKDTRLLIANFDPPTSNDEAIHVMDALWAEAEHDRLREMLKIPLIAESSDPSVTEMRKKYLARLAK
jgi:hypothetical protein